MIVVANRIPIVKEYREAFAKRFEGRSMMGRTPGFIRNEVLKPIQGDYFIVMTHWESMEAFEAWTQSDDFRQAHANPPPREWFAGQNLLEIHEVVSVSERKRDDT